MLLSSADYSAIPLCLFRSVYRLYHIHSVESWMHRRTNEMIKLLLPFGLR